jgi:thioredoxin reductase (NADPH)
VTTKPVILTIDDEPEVLRAVERDLRSRYASDYRIVGANSGPEAIEVLKTLAQRETPLALILADQRMPDVTGVDVMRASLESFPGAKRALLTAYADTDAAISAINDVGLDYYIMKPWDPPEEILYPVVDDLLSDWIAGYRPVFEGIRVLGPAWSRETHELKAFLTRNQIPYRSMDVETSEAAASLLRDSGLELSDLPAVFFPDSEPMTRPSPEAVAGRVGLHTTASSPAYDLVVVGGGPAGLAAAVYGSSEGLTTLLIEGEAPGGQAGQSSRIENYLGFPKGISGADLARRAVSQATRLGAELLVPANVLRIERKDPFRIVHLSDGTDVTARSVVVTSGVAYRHLSAEGMEPLTGLGVYYGTSRVEANQHREEPVFVVGGGNSAGQASLFLTGFTESVTILIRGEDLSSSMSQYLIDAIDANESITVRPQSQVTAVHGDSRLESVTIHDLASDEVVTVPASAIFIFIGQKANTAWLDELVELDDRGFIMTGQDVSPTIGWNVDRDRLPLETSVPGIFAAGDVRHGSIKRVAGATGEGATAIRFVHQHLSAL